LFEVIHLGLQHPLLDVLTVFIRSPYIWFPLYLFVLVFLIFNYRKRAIIPIVILSCAIGSADAISGHLVKKNVKRLRPCNQPLLKEKIRPLIGCGRAYSFTSNHAANHFCMATLFGIVHYKNNNFLVYLFKIVLLNRNYHKQFYVNYI